MVGVNKWLENNEKHEKKLVVSLETAHPAKFPEEINRILDIDPELPDSLKGLDDKPELIYKIENDYSSFKQFLISNLKN